MRPKTLIPRHDFTMEVGMMGMLSLLRKQTIYLSQIPKTCNISVAYLLIDTTDDTTDSTV